MDTKGGRVSVTVNSTTFSGRGAAKIESAQVTVKNIANTDGTGSKTVEAKLASLDMTFDRGKGFAWDSAMILEDVDVTFVEDDAGVTHYFTSAAWEGSPTVDTATGEVSGMKIMTDSYTNSNQSGS